MPLPMFSRLIATFVFMFFFAAATQAGTILVWGDSLSAGYGLEKGQEWPALLQTRLADKGFSHAVVNASVSGETSSGGRSRLPAALEAHMPDILVLELGANDGLRGLKPELLEDNLRAMITQARSTGARVLLVGMQMPPNYGLFYTRRFSAVYQTLAQTEQVALVPFLMDGFADRPELFQADGIHPTAEAQPLILETVWPALERLLAGAHTQQARH